MDRPKKSNTLLFENFKTELQALSGNALLLLETQLSDEIEKILIHQPCKKDIAIYDSPLLRKLKLEKIAPQISSRSIYRISDKKTDVFNEQDYYRSLTKAAIGLTTADYLIAHTGTVVFLNKNFPSKMLTLLPEVLIIIIKITRLVMDLVHLHRRLSVFGEDTSFLYLTGPSRTADIEKKLVLGVHGPKTLYVLVIKENQ